MHDKDDFGLFIFSHEIVSTLKLRALVTVFSLKGILEG